MGSVHSDELPYVFGAPLVEGFGHFPQNYTKTEVALSESIIMYFANFIRAGWVVNFTFQFCEKKFKFNSVEICHTWLL